jgi:hypothetical protein
VNFGSAGARGRKLLGGAAHSSSGVVYLRRRLTLQRPHGWHAHFVLFEEIGKAHTRPTGDSPAAFGSRMLSAVPLWKVIVGPYADKLAANGRLPQSERMSTVRVEVDWEP